MLSDPSPEAPVTDITDVESNTTKVRVLWWTEAPRQHEMLASYDKVLTAIGQVLGETNVDKRRAA